MSNRKSMRDRRPLTPAGAGREDGFVLLAVLFMLLLVLYSLAVAAPKMAVDLGRDREIEAMHRGLQYERAIQIYYRKFGSYPNTIDQLMNTNNQRFLRKRYLDPLTGKDDWRIIHVGEAKVPPMGLFGQPLQQVGAMPGILPTGATATPGDSSGTPPGASGTPSSTFGSPASSFGSSGFGSSGSSGSPFGASASPAGGTGASGSPFGGGASTSATGAAGSPPGGGPADSSSSAFGAPGATFGGAPIVGVGLPNPKKSIKIYHKQTHYNQWEFVYNPIQDLSNAAGGQTGGVMPQSGASNGIGGSTPGIGGSGGNSGSGIGGGSGPGGSMASPSPAPPTSPISPSGNAPQ